MIYDKKIEKLKNLLILLVIGFFSYVYVINTGKSICVFYNIFGIPCPACGMTRAVINLLRFNIREAFMYNPLFIILFIIPLAFINNKKKLNISIIITFISVWIVRMCIMFPNSNPMIFNENAVIPVIIKFLKYSL